MKITDVKILNSDKTWELQDEIIRYIKIGYSMYGNLVGVGESPWFRYIQVMVKYGEE